MSEALSCKFERIAGQPERVRLVIAWRGSSVLIDRQVDGRSLCEAVNDFALAIEGLNRAGAPVEISAEWPVQSVRPWTVRQKLADHLRAFIAWRRWHG